MTLQRDAGDRDGTGGGDVVPRRPRYGGFRLRPPDEAYR
jgi:hypothetical protein